MSYQTSVDPLLFDLSVSLVTSCLELFHNTKNVWWSVWGGSQVWWLEYCVQLTSGDPPGVHRDREMHGEEKYSWWKTRGDFFHVHSDVFSMCYVSVGLVWDELSPFRRLKLEKSREGVPFFFFFLPKHPTSIPYTMVMKEGFSLFLFTSPRRCLF